MKLWGKQNMKQYKIGGEGGVHILKSVKDADVIIQEIADIMKR